MFVSAGARDTLAARRRTQFADQYVAPLVRDADKLGMSGAEFRSVLDQWEERP